MSTRVPETLRLPPTASLGRRAIPAGVAFFVMLGFSAWGLGIEGRSGLIALLVSSLVAAMVALLTAVTDRAMRNDAAAFLAGLQDGGLAVRDPRGHEDAVGALDRVEFGTAFGNASFHVAFRWIVWRAPGSAVEAMLPLRQPRRVIGDAPRVLIRNLGRQQAQAVLAAAAPRRSKGD